MKNTDEQLESLKTMGALFEGLATQPAPRSLLKDLDDAIGELGVVTHYGAATTDRLDMEHLKSAETTLRSLRRRFTEMV